MRTVTVHERRMASSWLLLAAAVLVAASFPPAVQGQRDVTVFEQLAQRAGTTAR